MKLASYILLFCVLPNLFNSAQAQLLDSTSRQVYIQSSNSWSTTVDKNYFEYDQSNRLNLRKNFRIDPFSGTIQTGSIRYSYLTSNLLDSIISYGGNTNIVKEMTTMTYEPSGSLKTEIYTLYNSAFQELLPSTKDSLWTDSLTQTWFKKVSYYDPYQAVWEERFIDKVSLVRMGNVDTVFHYSIDSSASHVLGSASVRLFNPAKSLMRTERFRINQGGNWEPLDKKEWQYDSTGLRTSYKFYAWIWAAYQESFRQEYVRHTNGTIDTLYTYTNDGNGLELFDRTLYHYANPTSIQVAYFAPKIILFPNPVSDVLHCLNCSGQSLVLNSIGQTVKDLFISTELGEIPIHDLSEGFYILINGTMREKFQVIH